MKILHGLRFTSAFLASRIGATVVDLSAPIPLSTTKYYPNLSDTSRIFQILSVLPDSKRVTSKGSRAPGCTCKGWFAIGCSETPDAKFRCQCVQIACQTWNTLRSHQLWQFRRTLSFPCRTGPWAMQPCHDKMVGWLFNELKRLAQQGIASMPTVCRQRYAILKEFFFVVDCCETIT